MSLEKKVIAIYFVQIVSAKRVILISPPSYKYGYYLPGSMDGDLLYLGQKLFDDGKYNLKLLDNYANSYKPEALKEDIENFNPTILICHLWKVETQVNGYLSVFIEELKSLAIQFQFKVVFFGSISKTIDDFLIKEMDFSATVSKHGILCNDEDIEDICQTILKYYDSIPRLNANFLRKLNLGDKRIQSASIFSSKGCRNKCSFCSYNADLNSWIPRDIIDVASDIDLLHKEFGVKEFFLGDSNFGTNPTINIRRLKMLLELTKSIDEIHLSLNISLEGLSTEVIQYMSNCNVKSILIGVESFDKTTIEKIYSKRHTEMSKIIELLNLCEDNGIVPIVSFILFHPWLTFSGLLKELQRIRAFGRHRLVHFLANSKVDFVPQTKLFLRAKKEGLLNSNSITNDDLGFNFNDKKVEKFYLKLKTHFEENYKYPISHQQLSYLKMREWEMCEELMNYSMINNKQ